MLKRKPQLYNPSILNKLSNYQNIQYGGDVNINTNNKFSFITNTIIPFIKQYYLPIIIISLILLFFYWRYQNKIDEENKLKLLLKQIEAQKKKNKQFLHPQVDTKLPPANKQDNYKFYQQNQQLNEQFNQNGSCTTCNKDPYHFDEKTNDLMYRNNKGNLANDNQFDEYYGQSITIDQNDGNNMFTPSNGMGDHFFSLQ